MILKSNQQIPTCPLVCPLEIGNLHLVQVSVAASAAAQVCALYGWTLADLTTGMYSDAAEMIEECAPPNTPAYINSYNGINSTCVGFQADLSVVGGGPVIGFLLNPAICINLAYVFCQDASAPPAFTGSGPWIASASVESTLISTTVTVTVPSSTRTVTSFLPNCRIHLE
jgi:hypothetical protein